MTAAGTPGDGTFRPPVSGRGRSLRFVDPYRSTGRLNQVERWKLERHPLEVIDAIADRYAHEGPAAIATVPGEVERLKWAGIYPQRQGGDAFMVRVKVPGGVLTAAQARELGRIADAFAEGPAGSESREFGSRYVDLTTRQSVQFHWLRMEDIPRIWRRLDAVGLTTVQACGDSARNVLCCPLSGLDASEAFDALPIARAVSAFFTGRREYANLPRKFKISVTGCVENCARAEINDVGLWPARAEDGTLGFNLLVGGGLSDGERMASDIDVFVHLDQAVEVVRAVAQLFGELGNREHRGLARMRYLVEELGPEQFRAELVARAGVHLEPAGEELTHQHRGDHVGVQAQKQDGLLAVGCSVPVGRLHGCDLVELARLAESYGDGTLRLATDQNLVVTGVPERRLDDLLAEEVLARYSPFPGPFTRGIVACTGSEFCRFAVVETKERALRWARMLDAELGDQPVNEPRHSSQRGGAGPTEGRRGEADVVRMHFSGCSASCAQPQVADIGFRGAVAHVGDRLVEAVDVGLGGSLGPDPAFVDWVSGALPVDDVPMALVRLVRRYRGERRTGERFAAWARRTPVEQLREAVEGTSSAVEGTPPAVEVVP